jgi:hypothetical protein
LPGYWSFPAASQIPSDLLLPFAAFARKYGLEAAIPLMGFVSTSGLNDFTQVPTLYVMQAFGAPITRALVPGSGGSTFVPASRSNSELYSAIAALLGGDVLYSSIVARTQRSEQGVEVLVKRAGGNGNVTRARARRMLVAVEPVAENTATLGLSLEESAILHREQCRGCTWTS